MNESDACPMKLKKKKIEMKEKTGERLCYCMASQRASGHGRQESDSERERGKKLLN